MSPTKYEASIEYDPEFKPWPWFAQVRINGVRRGVMMSAMTRKGAIRQARRRVKRLLAETVRTEVIEL